VSTPILHVDMDAFYASVLLRDRPDLRDQPCIVGGGHRGVVLAASYPARAYGVRSGMTGTQARRLCPQVISLQPDYDAFTTVSRSVMAVFRRVTPLVEAVSFDEAFLDVRGSTRRLGAAVDIAEWVRSTVHDEQGITCSVGVAASVSVAKLASRRAKPDGVVVVPPDQVTAFLHPLDVGDLYGVGLSTQAMLHERGFRTVGDLAHTSLAALQQAVGRALGHQLHHLAWGTDRSELAPDAPGVFGYGARTGTTEPHRSVGAQETFGHDTADRTTVLREVLRLTARVAARLRKADLVGRTVTLTVRFSDFTTITRSRTLPEATDVTQEVYAAAVHLYDALGLRRVRVRLVGVRVENVLPRDRVHRQGVLGEPDHGWPDADRAVDRAVLRFGSAAVRPASLIR
jgi:DNA polymerase-4